MQLTITTIFIFSKYDNDEDHVMHLITQKQSLMINQMNSQKKIDMKIDRKINGFQ